MRGSHRPPTPPLRHTRLQLHHVMKRVKPVYEQLGPSTDMDYVDPILTLAQAIYSLVSEVKANRSRCKRLKLRIEYLMEPVKRLQKQNLQENDVIKVLQELKETMEAARDCIEAYTKRDWLKKVFRAYDTAEDFKYINERLNDASQALSLILQVDQAEQLRQAFEEKKISHEDEEDSQLDKDELLRKLDEVEGSITRKIEIVNDGMQHMKLEMKGMKDMIMSMMKPVDHPVQDIIEIKMEELDMDPTPFMETPTSKVYKAEFRKFPVVVKRFMNATFTESELRKIFRAEVETMTRFVCPNILRMYGICIINEGTSSSFLIVMEYCELGTLRNVLDDKARQLSWQERIQMSLDAARGLYRLHQSEEKFKVHGCINSARFLVNKGLEVKLAGFELAKTETSLKRSVRSVKKSTRFLPYMSPEQVSNVNHPYSKSCEIYSFGIVLWEISTREIPFKDQPSSQIYQRVVKDKYQEPLPQDCPSSLVCLINRCRSFDPFVRPTAGAVVDKLLCILKNLNVTTA
ncbi:mixed lineage kinase domain-like protein [Protopterus annectens]|uniref:mixed lineage kinase domain-like protein n=1 Tax=Protopterus annectens TaxID=7888 RepID=UPI001CFA1CB8|nr:mixed lineage kinase domain-like protein [Protopterus annectens]